MQSYQNMLNHIEKNSKVEYTHTNAIGQGETNNAFGTSKHGLYANIYVCSKLVSSLTIASAGIMSIIRQVRE